MATSGSILTMDMNNYDPPEIDRGNIENVAFVPFDFAQSKLKSANENIEKLQSAYRNHVAQLQAYHSNAAAAAKEHYENYILDLKKKSLNYIESQKKIIQKIQKEKEDEIKLKMSEIDMIRDDWARTTRSFQDDIRNLKSSHREERDIYRECQSCMNSILKSLEESDAKEREKVHSSNLNNLKENLVTNHLGVTKELSLRTSNQLQMQEEDNQARLMRLFEEKQQTSEVLTLSLEQERLKRQLLHDKHNELLKLLNDNNLMQLEDFELQMNRIKSHKQTIQLAIDEYNMNIQILQHQHTECLLMAYEDQLSVTHSHHVTYDTMKSKFESDQTLYQNIVLEHKNNIDMATEDLLSHINEKQTHFHHTMNHLQVQHESHKDMKQKEHDGLVLITKKLEDSIVRLEVQLHIEGMLSKVEVADVMNELELLKSSRIVLSPRVPIVNPRIHSPRGLQTQNSGRNFNLVPPFSPRGENSQQSLLGSPRLERLPQNHASQLSSAIQATVGTPRKVYELQEGSGETKDTAGAASAIQEVPEGSSEAKETVGAANAEQLVQEGLIEDQPTMGVPPIVLEVQGGTSDEPPPRKLSRSSQDTDKTALLTELPVPLQRPQDLQNLNNNNNSTSAGAPAGSPISNNALVVAARYLMDEISADLADAATIAAITSAAETVENNNNNTKVDDQENSDGKEVTTKIVVEHAKVPPLVLPTTTSIPTPSQVAALAGLRHALEIEIERVHKSTQQQQSEHTAKQEELNKLLEKEAKISHIKTVNKAKIKDWLNEFEKENGRPPTNSEKESEKELYKGYKQVRYRSFYITYCRKL